MADVQVSFAKAWNSIYNWIKGNNTDDVPKVEVSNAANIQVGSVAQGAAGEDPWKVTLNGSKARLSSAPVTGAKTVTATAAEVFAGASRKAGRSRLAIRNLDPAVRIRVGPSGVTDTTGYGIEPRAMAEIDIDPLADVPIYAISEAGYVSVEVFEG